MKVSRRSILGALFAVPLAPKVTKFGVDPVPAGNLMKINGTRIRCSDFTEMVEAYDERLKRYRATASFSVPPGTILCGAPITITFNGQLIFSGLARQVTRRIGSFDTVEACDALSLLPEPLYPIDVTGAKTDEELAARIGDVMMRQIRRAPSFS